jgi:hypothetical protein
MGGREMNETDATEAKLRAEWLHRHKAHKDWIILSVSEVAVIRAELEATERERDEAMEQVKELIYIGERAIELADLNFENDKFGVVSELRNDLEKIKKSQ